MALDYHKFGSEISDRSPQFIGAVLERLYVDRPELEERYGAAGRERCREDIAFHFCTLSESIAAQELGIWLKYIGWGKIVLGSRGVRLDDLIDALLIMQEVITENVKGKAAAVACEYIQTAVNKFDSFPRSVPSYIDSRAPLQKLANAYLQALLSVDRNDARKLIRGAIAAGTRVSEIFRYVFEPVQREVGRLWQMNQISVAQEHYCTATTEMLIGEISRDRDEIDRGPHFFLGTCVAGAHHTVGIRMLSELMESNGWKVYFTGANTPSSNLVELTSRFNIDVLGISAATCMELAVCRKLIASVKLKNKKKTRIMVGGRIFNEFPNLWSKVGADSWSQDAVSAVNVARELLPKAALKRARANGR
ncbi:MAG TPA: cobalamin-dependent protein [Terriglobales bacterium]|nr:cobalamin-dependent protein [Terriglobales bacterium]